MENEKEAQTLEIILYDDLISTRLVLSYTIYEDFPIITRNAKFIYEGEDKVTLTKAMSCSIDLPDYDYEMVHLSGAWSRERHIRNKKLDHGVQSIYSLRGTSSAEHNPFIALKRQAQLSLRARCMDLA